MIAKSLNEKPYMKKNVLTLNSSLFNYNQESKTFSQEISSLPIQSSREFLQQIFEDSCDIGFWMQSDRTGLYMLFVFEKVDENMFEDEKEICGWRFKSDEGLNLLITND